MTDAAYGVLESRVRGLEEEQSVQRARYHDLANVVTKLQEQAAQGAGLREDVTRLRIAVAELRTRLLTVGAVLALLLPPLTALAMRMLPPVTGGSP